MDKNVVLMILNQGFPDLRVCQEADALIEAGYEVWIVVSNLDSRSPEYDASLYNTIVIQLPKNIGIIDKLMSIAFFTNKKYENKLLNHDKFSAIKDNIFAIHVHDLHWFNFGYNIARSLCVKLVVDFHENSPALPEYFGKKIIRGSMFKTFANLFGTKFYLSLYENWAIRRADAVIFVVEENLERVKKKNYKAKLVIVSNTKDPIKYEPMGLSNDKRIVLFYHGSIQKNRGIRTLVKAFSKLDASKYKLVILGFKEGCLEKEYILNFYNQELPENILLINHSSNFEFIQDVLKEGDIGVIPHERCELTETTVPNKIFEYLCYGKPILVSDVSPLARITEESGAGFSFKAGNSDDLYRRVLQFGTKKDLLFFSSEARNSAESKFNWDFDKNRLVELYSSLKD